MIAKDNDSVANLIDVYPISTTLTTEEMDLINDTNQSLTDCQMAEKAQIEQLYVILPILLVCCFVAMLVNVIVIASARWIRCPMTPNLKISLSLAAADATSSTMYGLAILFDDYHLEVGALLNVVEMLRLSGIVITVVHLLALSLNHYIGILKPLHYNSIVTSKKVSAVICLLWLVPFVTVMSLCAGFDVNGTLKDSFLHNDDREPEFLLTFSFRVSYSSLFFIPIFIMVVCYTHILLVVRKQQTRWNALSRVGSTRVKGNSIGKPNQKINRERKQLEGNVRAIYTTLLILGSCFIGWTPAILIYTLTCPIGCYIRGEDLETLNCNYTALILSIRCIENFLVLLKMFANPIIYSIRMREIKDGTHRMFHATAAIFCKSRRDSFETSGYYYRSRMRNSVGGGTIQVRVTSMKNGNDNLIGGGEGGEENTFL